MKKACKNRGFSLIEIIVAIAILAIIVLPLLNAFVTSSKLNEKSRKQFQATEAAKNIMEKLKGYNIVEIAKGLASPTTTGFNLGSIDIGELTFFSGKYYPVSPLDKSVKVNSLGKYDFCPRADGQYSYFIKNIDTGRYSVNALVTLKGKPPGDERDRITNIDTDKDALINNATTAIEIVNEVKSDDTIDDEIRSKLSPDSIKRKMVLTVVNSKTVRAEFEYYLAGESTPLSIRASEKTVIANSTKEDIRSVYFFFTPWTDSPGGESIIVNNPTGKKLNLYLVKQKTVSTMSKKVDLEINDESVASGKSPIKVLTNIPSTDRQLKYRQASLRMSDDLVTIVDSLVEKSNTREANNFERVYETQVDIYDTTVQRDSLGTATPLVTLKGGMSN